MTEGIRSGSVPLMAASVVLFGSLVVVGHVIGRRAKRELEDRIRKRILLSTQPAI